MEEAIDNLKNLVVPLIGVGIILVVGFLIFSESKDVTIDLASTATVTNESIASYVVNLTQSLDYSTHALALSCTNLYNDSAHTFEIASNFTCGTSGINITYNMTGNETSALYVDYNYKNTTSAYKGISATQNATQDIPGWLAIIVIVVIGGILITLISYFRKK